MEAARIMEVLADASTSREEGIERLLSFMAPDGSRYFDSIYGSFFGRDAIAAWLVPTMAEIPFIDFRPTQEPVLLDDGEGGTSVDEWEMVAGDVSLGKGVSVRRYRGGFITWACDVYDTGPFRRPGPNGETAPLPAPPPLADWPRHPGAPVTRARDVDFDRDCDQFHPTDSVYIDPIFGEFHGRAGIREWITDVMPKCGDIEFVPVGPELADARAYVQEWVQMAVLPDGARVPMTRGTSVRRYREGSTVRAADYFDTATVMAPEVLAASIACGSTIGADDIMRWRAR